MSATNSLCKSGKFFNIDSPLKKKKKASPAVSLPLFVHMNVSFSSPRLYPVAIQGAIKEFFLFLKATLHINQGRSQLIIPCTSTYKTAVMICVVCFVILRKVAPK